METYLLLHQKYEHNILAWIDDCEILSVRKRFGNKYQYHIRLYSDGEIRGRYEIAPEYAPLKHITFEVYPKIHYFKKLLNEFLE